MVFGIAVIIAALARRAPVHGSASWCRRLVAFACTICFACAIDFATTDRPSTFASRLLKAFTFFAFVDTRALSRQRPRLDTRALIAVLSSAIVGASAALLWLVSPVIVRVVLGAVAILALTEMHTAVVRVVTALFGIAVPPVHDAPYRARTILEFWSKRWNRVGGRWFRHRARDRRAQMASCGGPRMDDDPPHLAAAAATSPDSCLGSPGT